MGEIVLKVYITGNSPESNRVLAILHEICEAQGLDYEVEVIDVLQNPKRAEVDKIVATPTVMRATPEPQRRVIGDLSDRDGAVEGLSLHSFNDPFIPKKVNYDAKN